MAAEIHVKASRSWKKVDISKAGFSQKDLADFISLEELTEYEIINRSLLKSQKIIDSEGNCPGTEANRSKKMTVEKTKRQEKKKNQQQQEKTLDITNVQSVEKTDETNVMKKKKQRDKKKRKQKKKGLNPKPEDTSDSIEYEPAKKKKKSDDSFVGGGKQVIEDINELKKSNDSGQKKRKRKGKELNSSRKKKIKTNYSEVSSSETNVEESQQEQVPVDRSSEGMDAWKDLFVPDEVLWALRDQGFTEPTPIQRQVLPAAIRDKMDIVGAAETGSGKTLAFGIPILHFILEQKQTELAKATKDNDGDDSDTEVKEKEDTDAGDNEDEDSLNTDTDRHAAESDDDDDDDDVEEENIPREDGSDGSDSDNFMENLEVKDCNGSEDENESEDKLETQEDQEASSDEQIEELGPDGRGCVKVIKDVDFSWLEEEQTEIMRPQFTHPRALVLEPTRELAIQVKNHLQAAAKYTDIRIAAIVGGLAMQKQQRILKRQPDIIVATPGRLWELVQQGEVYLCEIEKTSHLVIDEADRMIEKGHFEELTKLLERMKRDPSKQNRHTYVFSATLTMIHQGPNRIVKKKKKEWNEKQKLYYLVRKMGLKPKPKVVDITRKVGTVETLTEAKINCAKEDKDVYLYYFLKYYPGRTLVFTNSKDCIRRLVSIFTLLQCSPLPLHSDMHQRQRLKNLDRFSGNPKGLLIASDVAARGLDIPNVQHVIHYQVPHTVENYVHRSGRTARASKEGLSVMLIGPEDVKNYRKIIHTLNKSEDLPLFPVEQQILPEIRNRVNLVRNIETQEYRFKKSKRQNDWFRKAAEEAGVDIEDEGLLNDLGDNSEQQRHSQHIRQMKAELAILLKQPLHTSSSFTKYPTMSGKLALPPANDEHRDALSNVKKTRKVHQTDESHSDQSLKAGGKRRKWKKKKKHVHV